MIVMANLFPELRTAISLVRPLSKKRRFRTYFDSQQCESVPNTCEISMRVLLSSVFIILREADLENVSPSIR